MAKRRRRAASRKNELPGVVWMLFGLAIGLSVALAVYLRDDAPRTVDAAPVAREAARPEPAAPVTEREAEPAAEPAESPERRFDFYDMLPNFEVVIPDEEGKVTTDTESRAVVEPGEYILQAGSFTRFEDADRRRAQLALRGIESKVQRVSIDGRNYHRVRIGPIRDLDELNDLRGRLREANIDVLRIRLDD